MPNNRSVGKLHSPSNYILFYFSDTCQQGYKTRILYAKIAKRDANLNSGGICGSYFSCGIILSDFYDFSHSEIESKYNQDGNAKKQAFYATCNN